MINFNHYHFLFFLILFVNCACNNKPTEVKFDELAEDLKSVDVLQDSLLRHVVLFKFNDDATNEVVRKIENEFAGLPAKISEIHSFEWGINNSPEGLNKGLTHCFLVSFTSDEGRDKYIPHPAHKEFVKLIGPYVEDVTVVDYWAK